MKRLYYFFDKGAMQNILVFLEENNGLKKSLVQSSWTSVSFFAGHVTFLSSLS